MKNCRATRRCDCMRCYDDYDEDYEPSQEEMEELE